MVEEEVKEKREQLIANVKKFFSNKNETENDDSSKQREKLLKTLKERKQWIVYLALAIILYLSAKIRLLNLPLLKDITTGKYVPLALDPHLFLRYSKAIIEQGALFAHDASRFVPLGTDTIKDVFMASFISYLYKFFAIFSPAVTIEYIDVIYPVVTFVVGLFFFFLLVRRLFDWKVGLVATGFLAFIPAFLYRTMAGFSDHEALGVMLMFMAMYFFVRGWQTKNMKIALLWSGLAGLFTGFMGLSWGGWKFLVLIISIFTLVEFFFNKMSKKDVYQYFVWVIFFLIPITLIVPVFTISSLLSSITTSIAFLVFFMLLVDLLLVKKDLLKLKKKLPKKLPVSVSSFVISLVLGIVLLTIIIGPSAIGNKAGEVSDNLLHPLGNDRWQLTVAEQHQPYFTDWVAQFGPKWFGIPLYLTLFLLGSILLFRTMVKKHSRYRILTWTYIGFILLFILSRYSRDSTFNGSTPISKFLYLGSLALFVLLGIFFYFWTFYKDREEHQKILSWKKQAIFVLIWFLIMVIAARGAVRLFFIFAPITAVMAGYALVDLWNKCFKLRQTWAKVLTIILLLFVILSPFTFAMGVVPTFYKSSEGQARFTGPSYNQQWQVTGAWVRENVQEDAVFGHWWDYGYWVQNGFERASVLDGANRIKYWNFLMGRHVLTGQTQEEALEFLSAHETTHYLIVADEIGKYTAYSSIGSDADFDRYSWITPFRINPTRMQERRDGLTLVYEGGYVLDDDFIWDGIVFPKQQAGIASVSIPVLQSVDNESGEELITFEQPSVTLVYGGRPAQVPLECLYVNGEMVWFPEEGYKGCLRIIPTLQGSGQIENPIGAGLFVSEDGVRALWTNLYLFEQNNPKFDTSAFSLVYGEDDTFAPISMYQGRIIGPQKIWEINYPEGFTVDEETKQKYLGGNELLPDYFFDVN
jgi:asparagine N-glycosylation enzyme membrane subunit Stt3